MMQINGPTSNISGSKSLSATTTGKDAKADAKLKAACTEMEALFLNMLLTQMRRTVPKNKLFGESSQQEIMRSMLDSETTKDMAKAGGMGLADMLYRQLSLSSQVPKTASTDTSNKGQAPR